MKQKWRLHLEQGSVETSWAEQDANLDGALCGNDAKHGRYREVVVGVEGGEFVLELYGNIARKRKGLLKLLAYRYHSKVECGRAIDLGDDRVCVYWHLEARCYNMVPQEALFNGFL